MNVEVDPKRPHFLTCARWTGPVPAPPYKPLVSSSVKLDDLGHNLNHFSAKLQHRIHDIAVKAFYNQTSLVLSSLQQSGLQGSPPEDSAPSASFRAFLATVLCIELSFADKLR